MRRLFTLLTLFTITACSSGDPVAERQPTLSGEPPIIIAHRGASGELPEHTIEAYTRAIEQGADFIEPDLVMTRDGVLIARHDRYLSTTTDVADRPEFADRRREQDGWGGVRSDWWTEDFTLAEIKTLRARQPFDGRSKAFDDQFEIPTLAEVVALAQREGVGLYPETKSPSHHKRIGLDMVAPLQADLASFDGPLFVQSFEDDILRELNEITDWPLVMLYTAFPPAMASVSPPTLEDAAAFADGVGPDKTLLWNPDQTPTDYVQRVHALGLEVHPYTYRDDRYGVMHDSIEDELAKTFALGVDGVFIDFPETGVAAREVYLEAEG